MTQKQHLLQLLKENKEGLNSFGVARRLFLQLPARIWDLKQDGHTIREIQNSDKSVTYFLVNPVVSKTAEPVSPITSTHYHFSKDNYAQLIQGSTSDCKDCMGGQMGLI